MASTTPWPTSRPARSSARSSRSTTAHRPRRPTRPPRPRRSAPPVARRLPCGRAKLLDQPRSRTCFTWGRGAMPDAEILSAPLVLEYPFSRTVGPVQSAFLTGLREGLVLGVRAADGRVLCPPVEYDPVTSEELTELVELGDTGTVTTWSWEPEPRPHQPFDRPFAWALVRMDGADTAMLHSVDA